MATVLLAEPQRTGRPTKFRYRTIKALLTALRMGATKKLACDVAGISGETMYDWEDKFPDFAEAVTKAMGRRGVEALTDIRKAGRSGNWTASAWYLERTQPGYQLRRDENVGGWSDGEIQQALADLMAAQAKALDKQP